MPKPGPEIAYTTEVYGEVFDAVAEALCDKTGVLDLTDHGSDLIATRNRLIIKEKLCNDDFVAMMCEAIHHVRDVRMELNIQGAGGTSA